MKDCRRTGNRRLVRFINDGCGAVTVEYILWVPLFFLFLFASVQVSLLFVAQSNYYSVARDTAQLVARHALDTASAEVYAETKATLFNTAPDASVVVNGDSVDVVLSIPALRITALNPLNFGDSYKVVAAISQRLEPR